MRRTSLQFAVVVAAVLTTGCYTTRIQTGRPSNGQVFEDRQWFTIGGLAPISGPAGAQCQDGLSMAESQMSGFDILINIGLGVGGYLVGSLACGAGANTTEGAVLQASCATAASTLVPFLLGSRTVRYTCAAGAGDGQEDRRYDSSIQDDPKTPEREDLIAIAPYVMK